MALILNASIKIDDQNVTITLTNDVGGRLNRDHNDFNIPLNMVDSTAGEVCRKMLPKWLIKAYGEAQARNVHNLLAIVDPEAAGVEPTYDVLVSFDGEPQATHKAQMVSIAGREPTVNYLDVRDVTDYHWSLPLEEAKDLTARLEAAGFSVISDTDRDKS